MTSRKSTPRIKRVVFHVPADRGASSFAVSAVPAGYAFLSLERRGTRAVVTYRRVEGEPSKPARRRR